MQDEDRYIDLFHEVGKIFPDEVELKVVSPETPVPDALREMIQYRYSQLPVLEGESVRGVFSLWSLAKHLVSVPAISLADLFVEDVMEQLPTVTVESSLHSTLSALREHEAVLVASPHGLQAVVTPMDVLDYFYRVARPFILLGEIELERIRFSPGHIRRQRSNLRIRFLGTDRWPVR
jgi:CBS domain-containing protein